MVLSQQHFPMEVLQWACQGTAEGHASIFISLEGIRAPTAEICANFRRAVA